MLYPTSVRHVSLVEGDVAAATGGVFAKLVFLPHLTTAEDSRRQPPAATSLAEGGVTTRNFKNRWKKVKREN